MRYVSIPVLSLKAELGHGLFQSLFNLQPAAQRTLTSTIWLPFSLHKAWQGLRGLERNYDSMHEFS